MVACVATIRQEEETPATTASETATNPGALGNRRTLGGCLHTQRHTQRHPQKITVHSLTEVPLFNCNLAARGKDRRLHGETKIYDKFYWNHCRKQIINIKTVKMVRYCRSPRGVSENYAKRTEKGSGLFLLILVFDIYVYKGPSKR